MTTTTQPTAHEMLHINQLLRIESTCTQTIRAMLPLIDDADLRQLFEAGIKTSQTHSNTLVDYCKAHQLV